MPTDSAALTDGFVTSPDGTKLAYRHWPVQEPKLTFAVVHGLGEHAGRYERFARGMARFGMATYAVDLRGHGHSPGQRGHVDSWTQWVDDSAAFIRHVETRSDVEVVPLGHSFGGAALLSTVLARKAPEGRRFVVSSPALQLKVAVPGWKRTAGRLTSQLVPRLSMSNEVDPGVVSRLPDVVDAYRNDPLVHSRISSRMFAEWQRAATQILEHAGEIAVPFLILAGSADRLIDPAGSRRLHERAARMSELHVLEGGYHEPFNDRDSDEVFALIASWLGKQ